MIDIKIAKKTDFEVLALLGRVTYSESHGQYIDDKNDLEKHLNEAFSITKIKKEINDVNNHFYIMSVDGFPAGYLKLVTNSANESVQKGNCCRLEKIYILNDFIPLKIGQQLLSFAEEKTKELKFDTLWLSVYIKNDRAIRFYQKNEFKHVGSLNYLVNGTAYENIIFSKKI
jgi:ribosomal protein S18 acetylase RimI-like enzyme